MRYIFRLEGPKRFESGFCHETGAGMTGAYMAGIGYLDGIRGEYYDSDHPCPHALKINVNGKMVCLQDVLMEDDYFAFKDLLTARRWWYSREDLAIAQKAGYRLVVIPVEDVTDIRDLKSQIIYSPRPWGQGDCPVIRRVYVDATAIHSMSQEEIEAWADEVLESRERKAA